VGVERSLVVEDADELSRAAAALVADALAATPTASVVVATGRTPMGLYAELAARRASGVVDTAGVTAFQLDEYLGLEPGDRRSLFGWMRRSFLEPLEVADEHVIRLPIDGDLDDACAAFDRALEERGGLDLAILGLGSTDISASTSRPRTRAPRRAWSTSRRSRSTPTPTTGATSRTCRRGR
jgi:glucosamine-6-phosphate deaminase